MLPYCSKHQHHYNRIFTLNKRYACIKCMEEKSTQRGVDQLKGDEKR